MTIRTAKNQKLISVIMATFNCGQKVENTLRSIFSNNSELFEVIVIDAASTDGTLEILGKYTDRLTLISEKDDGVYDAFNKAIDLATGKYFYFIGAGDCLKPNILEEMKHYLPLDSPALVYGKVYFVQKERFNGKEFNAKLFVRDNLCQQGIFYHRDIFQIVGKFDLEYKILSDWFFNLKCFIDERIVTRYVDCVVADYEEGGLSANINCDPVFLRDFPRFVRQNFGVYQFLLCKAFLRSPLIFNYLYHREFYWLILHLTFKYPVLKNSASFVKGFLRRGKIGSLKRETME